MKNRKHNTAKTKFKRTVKLLVFYLSANFIGNPVGYKIVDKSIEKYWKADKQKGRI